MRPRRMLLAALLAVPAFAVAEAAPAAGPARAAPPKPSVALTSHIVSSGRFLIRAPGMTIGREAYVVSTGPEAGERTIGARAAASFRKGGTFRQHQELVLGPLGLVRRYEVTTQGPEGEARATLVAEADGWIMTARSAGSDSTRSLRVQGPADAVLLDPFFASHYQWLLDRVLAAGPSAPARDSVFVLTPQSLEARWVKVQEIQGEVGFEGERAVPVRVLELSIPHETTRLWFDSDGTLQRARLEGQWMEIVREGFRAASADSLLPRGEMKPLRPVALDPHATCMPLSLDWPASGGAFAVAVIVPDGGPPGAPAESAAADARRLNDRLLAGGVATAVLDPSRSRCEGAAAFARGWTRPAREALALLEQAGVPPGRIVIVGQGLGAVAACRIAASDTAGLGGVVLLAPPSEPARRWLAARAACAGAMGAAGDLGWSPVDWADVEAFDATDAAQSLGPALLVLSGSDDCETGGERSFREFANAIARRDRPQDEARLLPGLDHSFLPSAGASDPSPAGLFPDLLLWIRTALPENR